jgi:hypothetical protein
VALQLGGCMGSKNYSLKETAMLPKVTWGIGMIRKMCIILVRNYWQEGTSKET